MLKKYLFLMMISYILLLTACTHDTHSLQELYTNEDIKNIDKIVLTDGSTGYSKIITTKEQISELLELINDVEFSPQKNQQKREGWKYQVTFYDENKEFKFTADKIGEIYYDSEPDISLILDNYYEKLDVKEE